MNLTHIEIDAIATVLARKLQGSASSPFAHRLDDLEDLKRTQSLKCRAIAAERRKASRQEENKRGRPITSYDIAEIGKKRAQQRYINKVNRGLIIPEKICADCGSSDSRIVAHHTDYNLPFDVVYLCDKCHVWRHSKLNPDRIEPTQVKTLNSRADYK